MKEKQRNETAAAMFGPKGEGIQTAV